MAISNLPKWAGAESCYSRAYAMLERMATTGGHVTRHPATRRRAAYCTTTAEMDSIIDALNKGDEERIKAALLADRFPLPPLAKASR